MGTQLVASIHLSLARICCIIGGITTDAMRNTRKVAHLCGAVVFGPSKNSSRFVALTVEKDICRILLAPYHPWIEPFRSSENDMSVKWLAQTYQHMPSLPVNIAVAVGLKSKGGR